MEECGLFLCYMLDTRDLMRGKEMQRNREREKYIDEERLADKEYFERDGKKAEQFEWIEISKKKCLSRTTFESEHKVKGKSLQVWAGFVHLHEIASIRTEKAKTKPHHLRSIECHT